MKSQKRNEFQEKINEKSKKKQIKKLKKINEKSKKHQLKITENR